MLIDHPIATTRDRITDFIATNNGNDFEPMKIMEGVYQRGDFSILAARETALVDEHPRFAMGHCFGVCDEYIQVFNAIPELMASDRHFFITVTPIIYADDSAVDIDWQQWGPYIGDRIFREYSTDDDTGYGADDNANDYALLIYHVYEVIDGNSLH